MSVPNPSPDESNQPEEPRKSAPNGKMQMAAALAFHLPGARLDLRGVGGARCSIGPLTDPRCMLHPAEFREMLVSNKDIGDSMKSRQGDLLGTAPTLTLSSVVSGVRHVGSGLYRVAGIELTSYAFVTLLSARSVDAVFTNMDTPTPPEADNCPDADDSQTMGLAERDETISVNLTQDKGLGVTLVVMCSPNRSVASENTAERIARKAVAACLVGEMEIAIRDCT